jgi:hypothetical protein
MFNLKVLELLETYQSRVPLTQGPNINFKGPTPAGFLGGGLPGINPSKSIPIRLKKKKIKKKKA